MLSLSEDPPDDSQLASLFADGLLCTLHGTEACCLEAHLEQCRKIWEIAQRSQTQKHWRLTRNKAKELANQSLEKAKPKLKVQWYEALVTVLKDSTKNDSDEGEQAKWHPGKGNAKQACTGRTKQQFKARVSAPAITAESLGPRLSTDVNGGAASKGSSGMRSALLQARLNAQGVVKDEDATQTADDEEASEEGGSGEGSDPQSSGDQQASRDAAAYGATNKDQGRLSGEHVRVSGEKGRVSGEKGRVSGEQANHANGLQISMEVKPALIPNTPKEAQGHTNSVLSSSVLSLVPQVKSHGLNSAGHSEDAENYGAILEQQGGAGGGQAVGMPVKVRRPRNPGRVRIRKNSGRFQCMLGELNLGSWKEEQEALLVKEAANWKLSSEEERESTEWQELQEEHFDLLQKLSMEEFNGYLTSSGRGQEGLAWKDWVWANLTDQTKPVDGRHKKPSFSTLMEGWGNGAGAGGGGGPTVALKAEEPKVMSGSEAVVERGARQGEQWDLQVAPINQVLANAPFALPGSSSKKLVPRRKADFLNEARGFAAAGAVHGSPFSKRRRAESGPEDAAGNDGHPEDIMGRDQSSLRDLGAALINKSAASDM